MTVVETKTLGKSWDDYLLALLGVAAVTVLLTPFQNRINSTTVALVFLLVVLFIATYRGSRPALLASVLGMLSFNQTSTPFLCEQE
jgi:K+-sensing histidine kinase KdpD